MKFFRVFGFFANFGVLAIPAAEKAKKRMDKAMEKCEFFMAEAFDCHPPTKKIKKDW